jgi:hypothetical protein
MHVYSQWTQVFVTLDVTLYISYKTIFIKNIIVKSFLNEYWSFLHQEKQKYLEFNATFNIILAILWWSVLLVEKTTDLSPVTDNFYHIMLYTTPWSVSDCCLAPTQQLFSYIMDKTSYFKWNDVRFVLDQHA